MMKKSICAPLAAVVAAVALSACGGGGVRAAKVWEHTAATSLVYDCLGGKGDVMPLLGYWSAPTDATLDGQYFPEMKTDAYYSAVKEAGINLLIQHNDDIYNSPAAAERTFEMCDKYGLGYYLTDSRLSNDGALATTVGQMTERFKEYAKHPSFAGLYIKDEPIDGQEPAVRDTSVAFYEAAAAAGLNIHPYINMMPYWFSAWRDDIAKYHAHMDALLQDNPLAYLQYDIYPLKASGFDYTWYFTNLSAVRMKAAEYGVAWVPFVSVSGEQSYNLPDEGELGWQVNAYLALGAKGISYFPINSPISFSDYVKNGDTVAMFDYFGNKTEVYYYVREVNRQLLAVDEYLMRATSHGVVLSGDMIGSECLTNGEILSGGFRELKKAAGGKAMIGCFDVAGKTCFYVVNNDMKQDASVTLELDARYAAAVIQRGETANVIGKKIKLSLAAGEGALVALK